jgi:hypothetical protein
MEIRSLLLLRFLSARVRVVFAPVLLRPCSTSTAARLLTTGSRLCLRSSSPVRVAAADRGRRQRRNYLLSLSPARTCMHRPSPCSTDVRLPPTTPSTSSGQFAVAGCGHRCRSPPSPEQRSFRSPSFSHAYATPPAVLCLLPSAAVVWSSERLTGEDVVDDKCCGGDQKLRKGSKSFGWWWSKDRLRRRRPGITPATREEV